MPRCYAEHQTLRLAWLASSLGARNSFGSFFFVPRSKQTETAASGNFAVMLEGVGVLGDLGIYSWDWRNTPTRKIVFNGLKTCLHSLRWIMVGNRLSLEQMTMNEYQVTYTNGEVVEIEAWTPELAQAIAEEDAEQDGRPSLSVVSVELLASQQTEP